MNDNASIHKSISSPSYPDFHARPPPTLPLSFLIVILLHNFLGAFTKYFSPQVDQISKLWLAISSKSQKTTFWHFSGSGPEVLQSHCLSRFCLSTVTNFRTTKRMIREREFLAAQSIGQIYFFYFFYLDHIVSRKLYLYPLELMQCHYLLYLLH